MVTQPIVDVLNITELALTKLTSYIKECKTKKAEQEAKSNLETDNKKVDDDDDETNCDDYSIDDVDVFAVSASDGLVDFVNLEYIAHGKRVAGIALAIIFLVTHYLVPNLFPLKYHWHLAFRFFSLRSSIFCARQPTPFHRC